MKDFFTQLFAPNQQGETNAFGNNPNHLSLAGLLLASGKPFDQALIEAAKITNENQALQAQRQKIAFDQFQKTQPEENVVFNPVTGESMLKIIQNGQVVGFKPIEGGFPVQRNPSTQNNTPAQESNMQLSQQYETPVEAKERRAIENEYFTQLRNEVKATNDSSIALQTIKDSLERTKTGIFSNTKQEIGGVGKEFFNSELGTGASDLANIDALSVSLIQPFISATKGAISDKEMAIFLSAVPNSTQLPATNQKIVEAMKLTIERKKEKLRAAEVWRKNGGNINDFEVMWADYINNNPIITQDNNGNINVNKNNASNWKQKTSTTQTPFVEQSKAPSEIGRNDREYLLNIIRQGYPDYKG